MREHKQSLSAKPVNNSANKIRKAMMENVVALASDGVVSALNTCCDVQNLGAESIEINSLGEGRYGYLSPELWLFHQFAC